MWHTLANGDVSTIIESFCLTFRADNYVHYMIKRRVGDAILLSGSEESVSAALTSARLGLRRLLDGRLCGAAKVRAEWLIEHLTDTPLPLTNARNPVHNAI
jgi:hypothetical protein